MKFKGIVIGLLSAILVVNTAMAYMLVKEEKVQTKEIRWLKGYQEVTARYEENWNNYYGGMQSKKQYQEETCYIRDMFYKIKQEELGIR